MFLVLWRLQEMPVAQLTSRSTTHGGTESSTPLSMNHLVATSAWPHRASLLEAPERAHPADRDAKGPAHLCHSLLQAAGPAWYLEHKP